MSRPALTRDGAIYPALQACQLLFMYRQEEILTPDISDTDRPEENESENGRGDGGEGRAEALSALT